jgi:NADH:ubiquinone oxidoreductase subunit C
MKVFNNLSLFILLKFFFKFDQLVDIAGVDNLVKFTEKSRFAIFYNFLNINFPERLMLEVKGNLLDYFPSVFQVFESALWPEREIWDLFGIFFSNHPDLRRLLTDYGFLGFPLRKDFPSVGFFDLVFDQEKESLRYQQLELVEENRNFLYRKSW